MKTIISMSVVILSLLSAQSSMAQFDLGSVLKGEARQFARNIERNVRDQIRREVQPRYETLPYYPPVVVEQPICRQPAPIVHPIPAPITIPVPQPPVEPTPKELPTVESGSLISIEGTGFGHQPGAVLVKIESIVMSAELVDWKNGLAEAKLPSLPIVAQTEAIVFVMTANEEVAKQIDVSLIPSTASVDDNDEQAGPVETDLPIVHSQQEVTLEGELGTDRGKVELIIGALRLQAAISSWSNTETTVTLPKLETTETVPASLIVYQKGGSIVEQLDVAFSGSPN